MQVFHSFDYILTFLSLTLDFIRKMLYNVIALGVYPMADDKMSGCGEVWYRAWFGTRRPWVQIPSLRPKILPFEVGFCIYCTKTAVFCASFSSNTYIPNRPVILFGHTIPPFFLLCQKNKPSTYKMNCTNLCVQYKLVQFKPPL